MIHLYVSREVAKFSKFEQVMGRYTERIDTSDPFACVLRVKISKKSATRLRCCEDAQFLFHKHSTKGSAELTWEQMEPITPGNLREILL